MAEQKAYDGFNNRWKFTGKELDEETGLYYFGARFYNPVTSLWLSVDPLVEKTMDAYGYCYQNPIILIDPDGRQPGPFRLGKHKSPVFVYDRGFSGGMKTRDPNYKDYSSFAWWGVKTVGATFLRWDLGNALTAYRHFRSGRGTDLKFDLPDYYDDDKSGKTMLKNSINIAKKSAEQLLKSSGKIQMTSEAFKVGDSDLRFPYPDSEDWQKAVGGFNFWMSADITASEKKGVISYTMKLTINAEDLYNFNPGQMDIETGTPDADNGKFEETGLGKQFMQYGTSTHTIEWKVKAPKPAPKPATPSTP